MTVLKSDRQKEFKNGVFMLFPRVFGHAKILSEFFCILHHHLSQSLRKILLIKLIPNTLCMSISSPESSASLASFFLCNWCDSRDLVISSSSSPSLMASRNDVTDGMEVKEGLFWRPARLQCILGRQPLGLGSIVVIFLQGEDLFYFYFYSVDSDSTYWNLSKNDFFEILSIFLGLRQNFGLFFWQIFTFGKSVCTIQKIYSIPAYSDGFRTFKKSLPASINQSTNLLTLIVRNCKAKVTKIVRAFSCLWYPGLLIKINVKAEAKVSVVFRGEAKFINTQTNSGKEWNFWEKMLSLDDARWKARCAESVQLSFEFYEWEYSNNFLPCEKGRKYLQERVSPHIISISKIIAYLSTFSPFWLATSQKAERWEIYLPKKKLKPNLML